MGKEFHSPENDGNSGASREVFRRMTEEDIDTAVALNLSEQSAGRPTEQPLTEQEVKELLTPEEKERRDKNRETAREAKRIQQEIVTNIFPRLGRDPLFELNRIKVWEALQMGQLTQLDPVAQASHKVERIAFSDRSPSSVALDTQEIAGYVKRESGRARFCLAPDGRVMKVEYHWNDAHHSYTRIEIPLKDAHFSQPAQERFVDQYVREKTSQVETIKKLSAEHYGISPNDIEIDLENIGTRITVPDALTRNIGVSALSLLTNIRNVPMTVVREEQHSDPLIDQRDLFVVSEAIDGKQPGGKYPGAKAMTMEDYLEIRKQGPSHPLAKAFMRAACTAYANGALDMRLDNLIVFKDQIFITDTDDFFGYRTTQTIEGGKISSPAEQMNAAPLELVAAMSDFKAFLAPGTEPTWDMEDWILDEEARTSYKQLYETCKQVLKQTEEAGQEEFLEPKAAQKDRIAKESRREGENKVPAALSDIFRFMFKNETVAKKELLDYLDRIHELATHGRPRSLVPMGEINMMTENLARIPLGEAAETEKRAA
jgi:hypothetical protein